jgi:sterol desaturase/sphingolipid hydroxylase (fatty acid hydroxylase superfamily)
MVKWLGNLFSSESMVDNAMSAVGKMVFTQEEKSDYLLRFLKAYEPFKIAQRLLALSFSSVFLLVYIISVGIFLLGTFAKEEFYVLQAYELMKWNTDTLGLTVSIIIGFYFAGGMLEGAVRARIK